MEHSTVTVKQPVSPMNCSLEDHLPLGKSLLETPFVFSRAYNVLAVLGCKNVVTLLQNATTTAGGCAAICGYGYNSTYASCNGINCCQTNIPRGLKNLQILYRSVDANATNTCGYAFLVDHNWLQNDYRKYAGLLGTLYPFDESSQYAPAVLEWEFLVGSSDSTVYCEYRGLDLDGPIDYNSLLRQCQCQGGFEGNPYLDKGCEDIDECSNSALFSSQGGNCINTAGSYRCGKSRVKMAFIGVGAGLGALVLLIGTWMSYKVIRKRIKENLRQKFFKCNGGLLLEQQLSATENGVERTKLFSSKELAQATDHYNENRILGQGGQGTVYKGMLSDGRIVAVKKSKEVDEGDIEVFINEVVIVSQINHRNVVKLLGCCLETEVPLLVYEFIPNGTLFQYIHNLNEEFPLSWEIRLRIATEVAGALYYLHSAASVPIYHRDIKSTNILLDDKYRAKISDFGTSRSVSIDQTHLTTRVIGTFGYLDPEYFQSSQFTEKSDVYSFGVVMIELLTGQRAISSVKLQEGRGLAAHFLQSMEENHLFDILDVRVLKEGTKEEIVAIAQLARRCLHLNGKRRPTMKEVAVELEGIHMLKKGSACQDKLVEIESHSIEVYEVRDFESTSGSIRSDNITTSSES